LRLSGQVPVRLSPLEHLQYAWLPWRDAADKVFSWSNADAIRQLAQRAGGVSNNPVRVTDNGEK